MKKARESQVNYIGVIGSRQLKHTLAYDVGDVVEDLLERNYNIATGGAVGADQFVIERLLRLGKSEHCTVHSPWKYYAGFPVTVRAMMRQFKEYGGIIRWGASTGKEAHHIIRLSLLIRNQQLVDSCYGLVAFIDSHSTGSIFTIKKAAIKKMPLVVFPYESDLPEISHVKWAKLNCGGCWDGGFKAVYLR